MCKVDSNHNIMAQQASNNEMWVVKRSDIGSLGKPKMVLLTSLNEAFFIVYI
jgi:hypothetical protein